MIDTPFTDPAIPSIDRLLENFNPGAFWLLFCLNLVLSARVAGTLALCSTDTDLPLPSCGGRYLEIMAAIPNPP